MTRFLQRRGVGVPEVVSVVGAVVSAMVLIAILNSIHGGARVFLSVLWIIVVLVVGRFVSHWRRNKQKAR